MKDHYRKNKLSREEKAEQSGQGLSGTHNGYQNDGYQNDGYQGNGTEYNGYQNDGQLGSNGPHGRDQIRV